MIEAELMSRTSDNFKRVYAGIKQTAVKSARWPVSALCIVLTVHKGINFFSLIATHYKNFISMT